MDERLTSALARLTEEWRRSSAVLEIARGLVEDLARSADDFVGLPLPETMVRNRLPTPIASAWIFALRPRTHNAAHVHPNSTQHTAVIGGRGRLFVGGEEVELEPFDVARPERALRVIPAGTDHSFEPGDEPLVVLSFHTVAAEALVEIEVGSQTARHYLERPHRASRESEERGLAIREDGPKRFLRPPLNQSIMRPVQAARPRGRKDRT
jgi:quercetin dioxygenase-like cupin family protein